jgi:hypothetical protein
MGAGASAQKAGKDKPDAAGALSAAADDAAAGKLDAAKKIFKAIDKNKNGKLSKDEIKEAVKSYGKSIKSVWTATHIAETIAFYDRDKDGELNEAEFLEAIKELNKRAAEPKVPAREESQAVKDHRALFDKHKDKESGEFTLKHMAALLREINENEGIWDDNQFGLIVKSELAKASGSDEKKPKLGVDCFLAWYPGFYDSQVKAIIDQRERDRAARQAAKEAGSKPSFEGAVWSCPMEKLMEAYEQCWKNEVTPLLIDCTTPDDADRQGSFSPLETFFSYSSDAYIEMKKAVVETGMKKTKTVAEVQDEFAKTLLRALKQGQNFILLLSNAAPPFTSKFASAAHLPKEVLDAKEVKKVLGPDAELEKSWVYPVVENGDKQAWQSNDVTLLAKNGIAHQNFRTVVVTKFEPDDYADFLSNGNEWPLELMQPIKVFTQDRSSG